jgi:hypothetical protein
MSKYERRRPAENEKGELASFLFLEKGNAIKSILFSEATPASHRRVLALVCSG